MSSQVSNNAAGAAAAADDKKDRESHKKKPPPKPPREEYSARSVSYLLLALGSLINLSSVSNLKHESDFAGNQQVGFSFGAATFGLSLLLLILDRTVLDVTKAANGKLEGTILLAFTLWWTVGVGYMTQVRGMAYAALNGYASAWITWALSIHTLNQWSASKDILTIAEMTSISETLKSWYILALSSMVVTGSSLDFRFKAGALYTDDAVFGFCLGLCSMLVAWGWILTHMNFVTTCQEGGWFEAASAWVVILVWIVNCAVLTRDGGIGSTIVGTRYRWTTATEEALEEEYPFDLAASELLTNCSLSWTTIEDELHTTIPLACPMNQGIPGSNLFLASWISLGTSINVALRWNAQRALELAQSTEYRNRATTSRNNKSNILSHTAQPTRTADDGNDDNDGDDDLEDFIDANAY